VARAAVLLLLLASLGVDPSSSAAQDAKAAVEAFVARLSDISVTDLVIVQKVTFYDPAGRHPQSTGEQRVLFKLPRRLRVERTVEGEREVRLVVGDRAFVREPAGKVYEVPAALNGSDRTDLLVPFRRGAADLLAEWRALGVRADVSHVVRLRDRPITVIGAKPGDRDVPAVWLDAEYGVVRFVTSVPRGTLPTGPATLDLAFSEHRPLRGGFFFPYRQEAFVNSKLLLLITVRSVQVNTDPPDALFDPDALRREP
jgi:outer membrane lipoprotein-sorting protein